MTELFDAVGMVFGPPSRPGLAGLSLDAQARLVGAYRWIEQRLFELLGGWAATEPVAEVRVLWSTLARQHAWHADLWAERLPAIDGVDPDSLTVVRGNTAQVFSLLGGSGRTDEASTQPAPVVGGTLGHLVGVGRVVLPRLVAGYGIHLRRCNPLTDAPVARVLRLVLSDEVEQWQAVELATQQLVRRPHDIEVLTAHQQALEAIVAADGPGMVPWPDGPARPVVPAYSLPADPAAPPGPAPSPTSTEMQSDRQA